MPFTCKYCGKTMDTAMEYYTHFIRECNQVPRTRRCPICGVKFRSIRLMKFHLINEALVENRHRSLILSRIS